MEHVLGKFSSQIFALLRIVGGLLFMQHGAQKLFGLLGGFGAEPGNTAQLFSRFGAAGIIEFFGGLLIVLGLFAGVAAFVASGQMAVAYFLAHAPRGGVPIQNGGELALLYCFLFLYIASRGSGRWSLDAVRKAK